LLSFRRLSPKEIRELHYSLDEYMAENAAKTGEPSSFDSGLMNAVLWRVRDQTNIIPAPLTKRF
jgi:hypothetical protein